MGLELELELGLGLELGLELEPELELGSIPVRCWKPKVSHLSRHSR